MSAHLCSQCGAPLEAGAKSCAFCGTAVDPAATGGSGTFHPPVMRRSLDAGEARERLRRHLYASFRTSRGVAREALAMPPLPCLQPCWLAYAEAKSNWAASIVGPKWTRQPLAGQLENVFRGLLLRRDPDGPKVFDGLALEPVPWDEDRDGSLPLFGELPRDMAEAVVLDFVKRREVEATMRFLPGRAARLSVNTSTQIKALTPVFRSTWRTEITWKNRRYEWTIDASTGEVTGPTPPGPIRGYLGSWAIAALVMLPALAFVVLVYFSAITGQAGNVAAATPAPSATAKPTPRPKPKASPVHKTP